jgi:hypothetical protein
MSPIIHVPNVLRNIEHAEENRAENGASSATETEESESETDENGARHEEEHSFDSSDSDADSGADSRTPPEGILPPRTPVAAPVSVRHAASSGWLAPR